MTRAKDISKILTDADISGNIDVDGTTNLDVTDIDGTLNVAGETTLATHLNMGDGDIIKLGDSADLTLKHDGSSGYVTNSTGNLLVQSGANAYIIVNSSENALAAVANGAVDLYHNNALKFSTATTGVNVTGGIGLGGTGTANILDDYEEGTWTPVATFGGGSSGITYSAGRQLGQYTKVGDTVHIYIHLEFTSKGSSTGALAITGLPFTVIGGGHHYIPAKTWISAMASLTETPTFRFVTATTTLDCYQMSSNTYSGITNSNCTDTSSFQISGQYYV